MTPTTYQCPNCQALLTGAAEACGSCGLRLRGPDYERLWWVLGQIRSLTDEADQLRQRLLAAPDPRPSYPAETPPVGGRPVDKAGPGGQQVLLGLGALLVLAASSIFLLAVWFLVGVYGQALIMAGLTLLAVHGGRLAARRGLDAAAETGAVIGSGMLVLDALGARRFGLFGLDGLAPELFGAAACGVVAALLLGAQRWAPRTRRDGSPARLPVTYVPVAAVLLVALPWFLLAYVEPEAPSLALVTGLLVVAAAHVAAAAGLWLLEGRRVTRVVTAVLGAAGVAYLAHLVVGFVTAHDAAASPLLRYGALAFVLLPVLGLVEAARRGLAPVAAAVAAVLVVATVPVADLRGPAVLGVALVTAAALALRGRGPVRAGGFVLLWMLAATGLLLSLTSSVSLHRLDLGGPSDGSLPGILVGTVPFALLALLGAGAAVRARDAGAALQAQAAVALLASRLLLETEGAKPWWATAAALLVLEGALAMYAARRGERGLEIGAVGFGAAYALVALTAAESISPLWLAGTLFLVGAVLIGYATSPGRFLVAYPAVAVNALGDWVLTEHAGVEVVEAYSLPVAAMLGVVGFLHWSRDRSLPSLLTMGPALGVALVPSLVVAVDEGSLPRLVGVTTAGIVVLLVGYAQAWKAPVAWGVLTLGFVGVTQGGAYVAQIPGWVTLGLGGAVLLAAGVRWEAATNAGRRGAAWFGTLT